MSHMIGSVHMYDCMGDVVVAVQVTDHDQSETWEERTFVLSWAFPGVGEQNHRTWLQNVCTELLELL